MFALVGMSYSIRAESLRANGREGFITLVLFINNGKGHFSYLPENLDEKSNLLYWVESDATFTPVSSCTTRSGVGTSDGLESLTEKPKKMDLARTLAP